MITEKILKDLVDECEEARVFAAQSGDIVLINLVEAHLEIYRLAGIGLKIEQGETNND